MKTKTENQSIAIVNGMEIKKNTLYKVTGKPDLDAPKFLVEMGISKYPSEEGVNSVGMTFISDSTNSGAGVYDTGLYISSPCYAGRNLADVKSIVKSLQTNIVEPYERLRGEGGNRDYTLTDHRNFDFWDKFCVNLWDGLVFDTSNVEHLFNMYVALQSHHLSGS